jgi:hypothetical protein
MGATNPPWKKFERECARDMGTERIPITGEREGADFATDMFRFSAKRRKDCLPAEVLRWLDSAQLAAMAEDKGRIPVVVIQRRGHARGEAVVLLRWADWRDLHGASRRAAEIATVIADIKAREARELEPRKAVHEGDDRTPASTPGQPGAK